MSDVHRNLILKKLKFDEFDGTIRKYPKFKQEFIKMITPRYRKDGEAFALVATLVALCVSDEIEYLGDETEQIWKRLDAKFGNEIKLIDLKLQHKNRA